MHTGHKTAFSLIELSIVLVILGLLVGGILAGQSLIRASQLRAVTSEYQRFTTAANSFRDKYFGLPGDITNASAIWGKSTAYCNSLTDAAGTPGTCNGNGNGTIEFNTSEMFLHWQHMALAGMIEGNYTGVSNGGARTSTPGLNVPASKLSGAGWSTANIPWVTPSTNTYYEFAGTYGNIYSFGAPYPSDLTIGGAITPEEVWNVDTKMDDGMPGYGRVYTVSTRALSPMNNCTTSGSPSTAVYNLTYSLPSCLIGFKTGY